MVIPLMAALLACLLFCIFGFLIGRVSQYSTISRLEEELEKLSNDRHRNEGYQENAQMDLRELRRIAGSIRSKALDVTTKVDDLDGFVRRSEETIGTASAIGRKQN